MNLSQKIISYSLLTEHVFCKFSFLRNPEELVNSLQFLLKSTLKKRIHPNFLQTVVN